MSQHLTLANLNASPIPSLACAAFSHQTHLRSVHFRAIPVSFQGVFGANKGSKNVKTGLKNVEKGSKRGRFSRFDADASKCLMHCKQGTYRKWLPNISGF